jgi:hypothetical protein
MHLPKISDFDTYGLFAEKYAELYPFRNDNPAMKAFVGALKGHMDAFEASRPQDHYRISA